MFKVKLPEIESANISTKDRIIHILASEYPLTAKKIYNALKKTSPLANISYQAVHKAIKELTMSKVLLKEEKGYKVNIKWVEAIKTFTEQLNEQYHNYTSSTDAIIKALNEKKTITLEFNAPEEAYDWWGTVETFKLGNEGFNMCKHDAYPLLTRKIIHKKKGKRIKWNLVLGGDTPVDKWVAEQYKKQPGKKATYGVPEAAAHWALIVIGDYVIQAYIDEKLKKGIHELFETITNPAEFDFNKFFSLTRMHSKYKVVITKDHEIAESYKNQIREYLKHANKN